MLDKYSHHEVASHFFVGRGQMRLHIRGWVLYLSLEVFYTLPFPPESSSQLHLEENETKIP